MIDINGNGEQMTLEVLKLKENAKLPTKAHETDGGWDLYALEDTFIQVGTTRTISTGIAVNIPIGYVGKIESRSSVASSGLFISGGVVDAGYAGEVSVILNNFSFRSNSEPVLHTYGKKIKADDKIAQLLIHRVEPSVVKEVKNVWTSNRGAKGFGSSGA